MTDLTDVLTLADELRQASNEADLLEPTRRFLGRHGYDHFPCISHVDPRAARRGSVHVLAFPPGYVDYYLGSGYMPIDPVIESAARATLPFQWADAIKEIDQFDNEHAQYLLAIQDNVVVGSMRLLPTTPSRIRSPRYSRICASARCRADPGSGKARAPASMRPCAAASGVTRSPAP